MHQNGNALLPTKLHSTSVRPLVQPHLSSPLSASRHTHTRARARHTHRARCRTLEPLGRCAVHRLVHRRLAHSHRRRCGSRVAAHACCADPMSTRTPEPNACAEYTLINPPSALFVRGLLRDVWWAVRSMPRQRRPRQGFPNHCNSLVVWPLRHEPRLRTQSYGSMEDACSDGRWSRELGPSISDTEIGLRVGRVIRCGYSINVHVVGEGRGTRISLPETHSE